METREIILDPGPLQPRYWALRNNVEVKARHVKQTCCPGYFAVVRLKFELHFGQEAVLFVDTLDQDSRVWCVAVEGPREANQLMGSWDSFTEMVVEGIRETLKAASPNDWPIQALKVSLVGMRVHPIDSWPAHFRQAAALAVSDALERVGLDVGPT